MRPSILCLQEVFVTTRRNYYKDQLERAGYHVCIPRDENVCLVNSGLLTAYLRSEYEYVSECFYPYMNYHNIEIFTNKGFFTTTFKDTATQRVFVITNTHMQSDTEITWVIGSSGTHRIRKAQHQQIVDTLHGAHPVLLIGDLNTDYSPHSSVRYMTLLDESRLQKSTFYSTGENLDHCAWFPLQWAAAHTTPPSTLSCSFCDFNRRGPRLTKCQVYQVPWSDHAPVLFSVFIPRESEVHAHT